MEWPDWRRGSSPTPPFSCARVEIAGYSRCPLDEAGNTISASGNLREYFKGVLRSPAKIRAQADAAAKGIAGDQGGHLAGHRFVRDQGDINLFPQEGQL
jgi:hypothetical protein